MPLTLLALGTISPTPISDSARREANHSRFGSPGGSHAYRTVRNSPRNRPLFCQRTFPESCSGLLIKSPAHAASLTERQDLYNYHLRPEVPIIGSLCACMHNMVAAHPTHCGDLSTALSLVQPWACPRTNHSIVHALSLWVSSGHARVRQSLATERSLHCEFPSYWSRSLASFFNSLLFSIISTTAFRAQDPVGLSLERPDIPGHADIT